ncbi:MAG: DUF3108 domain-containing protein [Rhodovibrionaceae bacterium]
MTYSPLRNSVLGLLGLAFLATPAAAEQLAPSDTVQATVMDLKYEIYAGGMLALVVKMETALGAERYRTLFKAEIAGPYSWFMDFAVKSQVEGLRADSVLQPASFVTESYKKDKLKRRVEISYLADGTLLTSVDPEPKKENRDEIPESLQLGTFDPLSAVLMLTQAAALQGSCESVVPVFDGRRRFDLTAEDLGSERIDSSRYQAFEGDARHCLVKFERLSGHKKGDMGVESSYPDNISVFLGQVESGLPFVPVRMEMDHKYGALRAHLVDVDIHEKPVALEAELHEGE